MTLFSARRLVLPCIVSAAAAAALLAPVAASASLGTQCSGGNIAGQGSTLQGLAQELWTKEFNVSSEKHACNGSQGSGEKPTVKYTETGSGAGLKSWGVSKKEKEEKGESAKFEATNAFIGTDEAPNETEKKEIEEEGTLIPNNLATVPVLQAAVAVLVHLPEKCVATSTSNKGRLVLNNSTLEAIWKGTVTKWSEITEDGDKLSGSGCNAETAIKHVVRLDGSGTTHIFKKYLGLINPSGQFPVTNVKGEARGNETWNEIAEGSENQSWPTADAVIRPANKGGKEEVAKVAEEASSVGYANVADARINPKFVPPEGGANKAIFWAPIENKASGTVTYADPASNKEAAAKAESNCTKEEYTNGTTAFPPSSVFESWSEVTTKTEEPKYTICGLTFDLSFKSFSAYSSKGATLGEATSVNNYLQYVLDTVKEKSGNKDNGGQSLIKAHDYEPLGTEVLKEAQKGAAQIGF